MLMNKPNSLQVPENLPSWNRDGMHPNATKNIRPGLDRIVDYEEVLLFNHFSKWVVGQKS